jgi:hypothetical protein
MHKRTTITLFVALALLVSALTGVAAGTSGRADQGGGKVVDSGLFGNDVTGADGMIRGLNAGGLPWRLDRGDAKLFSDGRLDLRVRGLVLAAGGNAGTNPQPLFQAIVSCLTTHDGGHVIENVSTGPFPASPEGDARVRAQLELPDPCLAPIIFVTSGAGTAWFAVNGL